MRKNTCRVIKIDKEALFEFIYENFIVQDEDEAGHIISFPKDIDIQKLLRKMPATTESALSPGKKYRDYTFDELRQIMNG